MGNTDWQTDK